MRKGIFIVISVALLGYVGYQIFHLLAPPLLIVLTPADRMKSQTRTIELRGSTYPGAKVTINGEAVLPTEAGDFSTLLVLGGGVNTIEVKAEKRYSRPRIITRTILVEEKTAALPDHGMPHL